MTNPKHLDATVTIPVGEHLYLMKTVERLRKETRKLRAQLTEVQDDEAAALLALAQANGILPKADKVADMADMADMRAVEPSRAIDANDDAR